MLHFVLHGKEITDVFFHFLPLLIHGVLIDILQRGIGAPPSPFDDILIGDAHGVQDRCLVMPLRYNYDKPEKPRFPRVFGYQARFFILFQPEKSSREVIIS